MTTTQPPMTPTERDREQGRDVIKQWIPDVDPDSPIFGEAVLLRDLIAAALAAREQETQPLRDAVVETASAYCQSVLDFEKHGYPRDIDINEWHGQHMEKQTAMIDAYKALEAARNEGNSK